MIAEQRCSVCGRLLGLMTSHADPGSQYCPDRPCILYPSVSASRSSDPTIPAWALAIHTSRKASATAVGAALGHNPAWLGQIATAQRKRWRRAAT